MESIIWSNKMGNKNCAYSAINDCVPSYILQQIAENGQCTNTKIRLTDRAGNLLPSYILVSIKDEELNILLCVPSTNNDFLDISMEKCRYRKNTDLELKLQSDNDPISGLIAELNLEVTQITDTSQYRLTGEYYINDEKVLFVCDQIVINKFGDNFTLVN